LTYVCEVTSNRLRSIQDESILHASAPLHRTEASAPALQVAIGPGCSSRIPASESPDAVTEIIPCAFACFAQVRIVCTSDVDVVAHSPYVMPRPGQVLIDGVIARHPSPAGINDRRLGAWRHGRRPSEVSFSLLLIPCTDFGVLGVRNKCDARLRVT
jgi:hypothetical protein